MRLSDFIRASTKAIIAEWESFARTLTPASDDMTPRALRDHIDQILVFIADDIDAPQSQIEQIDKSLGKKMALDDGAAEVHAYLRQAGGFDLDQMVSEFRALRSSVIRLWRAQLAEAAGSDVEDLIRFDEAVDQAVAASVAAYAKTLDHSRDMFWGILAHDLRNPLGAALMSAQLTLNLGPLSARQTMLVSQIVDSSRRAMEIVSNLLDLTRARLGSGIPVIRVPMDMGFVSRQLVDETRAAHPDRKIKIEISGDTEGHWDKPRIGQVLSNLLGNAVQYGFKDVPITLTVQGLAEEVTISVHNDGVPIPPSALERIFEALTRGDNSQKFSTNLGLGLYISSEIVSAHGGTIGVTSSERDGTTFTARFPRSNRVIQFDISRATTPVLAVRDDVG